MLDIPIIHALYDAYVLWHETLLKFPKTQRYALGQTCGQTLLAALESVLAAAGTTDVTVKMASLRRASAKLDVVKLLVRLAKDCECVSNNRYMAIEAKLHETGKMLGGWMKSLG